MSSDEWFEAEELSFSISSSAATSAAMAAGMTAAASSSSPSTSSSLMVVVEEAVERCSVPPMPNFCCYKTVDDDDDADAPPSKRKRERGAGGGKVKKNAKSQGRLPMYNIKQIEAWIEACGDEDRAPCGGNTERERALVYERLLSLVVQMTPKMHTKPSPGCRCPMCTAYCSWIIQEGQFLGYDMRLIPGHVAHTTPRISQRHS